MLLLLWEAMVARWQGDDVPDVEGLFNSDGDNRITGTLLKCPGGIRI